MCLPKLQVLAPFRLIYHSAAAGWRSRSTPPSRHCSLNRCIWPPPRYPHSTSSVRGSHRIYQLAQHLLAQLRPPISDPNTSMVVHARLSLHEPWRPKLFQDALEHHYHVVATSGSGASMSCRPLHLDCVHLFLDNSHLSPLFTTI